jgi:hypothetical protein
MAFLVFKKKDDALFPLLVNCGVGFFLLAQFVAGKIGPVGLIGIGNLLIVVAIVLKNWKLWGAAETEK